VSKAAQRIKECFERAKGEAGLGDYRVRPWGAWHHHQTLSLLAAWFLNQETRRGKNRDSRADAAAIAAVDRRPDRGAPPGERARSALPSGHPVATSQRASQAGSPPIA
jgi:hypothetical protein